MKTIIRVSLLLASTALFFSSCHKDKDPKPENPSFNKQEISILAGGIDDHNVYFNANGQGSYKIVNINPEIATATLAEDGKLTIETTDIGEAVIRAVNTTNPNLYRDIKVHSVTFGGSFTENGYYVDITTPDSDVEESILEAAREYYNEKYLSYYVFNPETGRLNVLYTPITGSGIGSPQLYQGTFSWDKDTQKLNLTYNNNTEEYTTKQNPVSGSIWLLEDFTQDYQNLYPDAGITKVVFGRNLSGQLGVYE